MTFHAPQRATGGREHRGRLVPRRRPAFAPQTLIKEPRSTLTSVVGGPRGGVLAAWQMNAWAGVLERPKELHVMLQRPGEAFGPPVRLGHFDAHLSEPSLAADGSGAAAWNRGSLVRAHCSRRHAHDREVVLIQMVLWRPSALRTLLARMRPPGRVVAARLGDSCCTHLLAPPGGNSATDLASKHSPDSRYRFDSDFCLRRVRFGVRRRGAGEEAQQSSWRRAGRERLAGADEGGGSACERPYV